MKIFILSFVIACSVGLATAQTKNRVDDIADCYISLKNALVGSNPALAKAKAKDLLATLSEPINGLTPNQKKIVAAYLDKLKYDSRYISQTTFIANQRKHFESLSSNMYKLLSGLKMHSTPLYEQYCPMKKAYWLSETEDIRNPYYGEDMLECGKVTGTLKGAK